MRSLVTLAVAVSMAATASAATMVKVTIENLAPAQGTHLTPLWVGFHNGSFDIYDLGVVASMALERLAEDGNASALGMDLMMSGNGAAAGTFPAAPPIAPGERYSRVFTLDPMSPLSRYFSYASMIIPSNDLFIANGNPMAHQVFDATGDFMAVGFTIMGNTVRDAGTEVNDEIPANTAFLGQAMPNTGTPENGVVTTASGFMPGGNVLSAFPNADFTSPGYQIARITVEEIPEPGTWMLMLTGLSLAVLGERRRRRVS